MSTSPSSLPPTAAALGDEAAAVLISALEHAPAAIYCLRAEGAGPVWANARARARGMVLPIVGGRSVADLVNRVLRTGAPETVSGPLGTDGPDSTVVVRPLEVAGKPGALLFIGAEGTDEESTPWPAPGDDAVEQAQLSLLPPSLPLLPDLHLSGSYHRAAYDDAAGGDWYDAVPLGGGKLALVVGDAVGHGIPAVGAMGRLRGAMRSSALRDPAPDAVLAALDAFAAQMDDVEGASVFYGVLDAATGRLVYTAAGHPPPLVVHPDGSATSLPLTARPPLGSVPGTSVPVAEHVLELGATLILFSNGALAADPVEGRGRLADVARELLAVPGALEDEAPGGLASAIAEAVRHPDGWPDDVAVLVAHRRATTQEPLRLDLTATPSALPGVRRRLGSWLEALGMSEQDRISVMVAAGEACANAAEHAYRGTEPGPMSVEARVDVDGVLTITVQDEGTWHPPNRDPGDRGRGLLIMRQLVDGVVIEEGEGTTVTLRLRLRRALDADTERAMGTARANVIVDRDGELPVVRVEGAVDEISAEHLRIRLLEASHGGTGKVELDLVRVALFSSAAVRVVLAVARIARDERWRLVVHAPEGGVTRHVLEISGLAGLVDLR